MKSDVQLNALIRNLSKEKNVNAQILLRNFMLEKLLEKISLSTYRENFILKGGMLIANIIGVDLRSTMDMDATISGFEVSEETIREMFLQILSVQTSSEIEMELEKVERIREEDDYAGFRISLRVNFGRIKQDLKVDITTGDSITPCAVEYAYKMLLNDMVIPIFSYNLESVLAEKFETILSRGIANTRMRDFYDIHILLKLNPSDISYETFSRALNETARRRGTLSLINDSLRLVKEIKIDPEMESRWLRYQKKSPYAAEIGWSEVLESVELFARLPVYV